MSYTAPNGDAANFLQTGALYTAPYADAADFQWAPDVPTFRLSGRSTTLFRAGFGFAISSTSTTQFEHPFRAVFIASSSDAAFYTLLRHFDIQASSTALFRYGFIARIQSETTLAPSAIAGYPAQHTIPCSSVIGASGAANVYTKFSGLGRSVFSGTAVFNKRMAMRINTSSEFSPSPSFMAPSVFLMGAQSALSAKTLPLHRVSFSIDSSSVPGLLGGSSYRSTALSSGGSSTAFLSSTTLAGGASVSSGSQAQFFSGYETYQPVDIDDGALVIIHKSARNEVFVRA